MKAAIYHGIVTHRRMRPVMHALRYRIFMVALDIDAGPAPLPRLFGFDRAGLLSFHQRDHGEGTRQGLRAWIDRQLIQAGAPPATTCQVLCMPRVFGHAFNPLSVFLCHGPQGALHSVIYEVNNTFGQRHAYTLPVSACHHAGRAVHQNCAKTFHVSPFMDMDLQYRFRLRPPEDTASVVIQAADSCGVILTAGFAGRATSLTNASIMGAALRMPWLGLMVLGGIHWEAVKLWRKGLKLRPAPVAAS
jgi:DUF1365 family protein